MRFDFIGRNIKKHDNALLEKIPNHKYKILSSRFHITMPGSVPILKKDIHLFT
jgi:hypothetical protein